MKTRLILFLIGIATLGFAQKPNNANRLPVTPDMPEWAKQLYRDDIDVNVFELDEQFESWEEAYEVEHEADVDETPSEWESKGVVEENLWEEYYERWRARVNPYVLPDGSLDFSIITDKDIVWPVDQAAKLNSTTWNYLGPVLTRWTKNDNSAQPLCPWQANIYCLDVAPSDPNTLYYGSESGVVGKTTDKGLNWTPLGANFFTNNIGAIAIHPSNPGIVYASELPNNIATSTDGGLSWSVALAISNFNSEDIKVKPDEPEVVLAAGTSLQRRTAGNVWTNVLNKRSYDIAFKPDDPSIVYVLVKNTVLDLCEFWKSTDGGQTFTIRSSGWITGLTDGGGRLAVSPANSNRIYAALLTGGGPRVMRSDNAGETWTIIASSNATGLIGPCTTGALSMTTGQGYYDMSIAASATNADQIILGTTTSFKSVDGGVSYTLLGGYCGTFDIHPDIQEMVSKSGDTWICTDGGINLSTDFFSSTANYFARISNMRGSEHWGFDNGWNENVLIGGRYHDGNMAWRETYPAGDFLRMGGGEAPTGYVNPGNASMLYYSDIGGKILPASNNQLVQSFTVNKWPNESFYPMEGAEQKWDPRYMYTYYLGNGNQFWKTTDNGVNFTALFTHSSATAEIRYVEVSRSNPDVMYFTVNVTSPSNDGELWKTTDGGANWTKCNNPGTLTASQRRFSKITMSGTDANTLWWCFRTGPNGQKVFKSSDGGATWTNWTTTTLDNLNATDILHQLGTNGGVYFVSGSGGKILYRDNVASDWTVYNAGLPLNLYGDFGGVIAKPYYKGGKLRIGTGNGVWEADLFTSSTTTLVQPMVDYPSPSCSRDTVQLESYSVINGAATYQWSVTPAPQWISATNIRNPRLVLGTTPGFYTVSLTITDANGVTSRTINNFLNNLAGGDLCSVDTIPGKSLSLDGSGDYALPNANLNLNSNTVSMTAWIKRNGTQVDFSGLVYARGGSTSAGLSITSGNALRYTWDDAAGSYNFNTNFTIPDNTWTHIALVIAPGSATVYMNGVPVTRTAAHAAEAFDTPVKIGYDNGSRYFKGQIDEVTVWNKSLTQNEVRELMHLTQIPASQPNLVSYYQFNEVSGIAFDKVSSRHATLAGNATRVVSSGPFGGGKSFRLSVTTSGLKDFAGTGVKLAFANCGVNAFPSGEVVVNRINLAPFAAPCSNTYASDNHYWIIDNYGTNQSFAALDSARFDNVLVPGLPAGSLELSRRDVNSDLSFWAKQPGSAIGATSGANGRISFGSSSVITQFGQFYITDPATLISGPTSICSGNNAILDAGTGFSAYTWSNSGGTGQTATFITPAETTTYTVTLTGAAGCQAMREKVVAVNATPTNVLITPPAPSICYGNNVVLNASADLSALNQPLGTGALTTSGSSTTATLGPDPLQNQYGGSKQLMLIKASELAGLGMVNGSKISGLSISLATANTAYALLNLRVKVQSTNLSALSTFVTTGWATVRAPSSFTPAGTGWNPIAFDAGQFYTWDGTSNLLLEINYTNVSVGSSGTKNTALYGSCGSDLVTLFYRADNVTAAAIDAFSGAPSFSYFSRNNLQFLITGATSYTWSPATGLNTTSGPSVTATPTNTLTYTLTANNVGCTTTQTASVSVNPTPAVVSGPSTVCSGGSATLDAGAGYTSYAWSDGGGSAQTANFTNITAPTTYTVTVTDANSCSRSSTKTVLANPLPVMTCPGNSTVNLSDPAFGLSGGMPSGGAYSGTGVSGNVFNPASAGLGMHTISYSYTDGNTCSNLCTFTIMVISSNVNIDGKLIWEGDRLTTMTGVNNATVTLSGDAAATNSTGIPGTYTFTSVSGSNLVVTPLKNVPMPAAVNGLSAADASRIQQHVLGAFPITDPYKMIAADANKSNSISSADANLIQQATLGSPVAQSWFINNTWRFVPKAYVFPVPLNPWSLGTPPYFPESISLSGGAGAQDFIGIKLGDANQSANPANTPNGFAPNLVWMLREQELEQDANYSVEFRTAHFDDLLALQFALQFDPTKIQFLNIETIPGSPMQVDNFGLYNVSAGEIRAFLALAESETFPDGTLGFRLKFKALQNCPKLSDVLFLGNMIAPEAYSSNFTAGPVNLEFEDKLTGTSEPGATNFRLLQNRPNPFKNTTSIGFILPEACEAKIRIFDLCGHLVEERKDWFTSGYNERSFHFDTYTGNGVLYYELVTPFGILSKKMVLLGN